MMVCTFFNIMGIEIINFFLFCFPQDNINIEEASRFLVEHILANLKTFPSEENDIGKIKLDPDPLKAESKSQCC